MGYGDAEFVLAFFAIVVGIPVVCGTLVKIIHGPKEYRKEKQRKRDQSDQLNSEKNQEMLEEIYYGLSDMGKRVKNLETILDDQDRGE